MAEKNKDNFEIPITGNLGLLALGYAGLVAWRKKKAEFKKQVIQERKKKNEG